MKRSFLLVAALTVLAVLLLWLAAPTGQAPDATRAEALLLPDMSEHINEVDRVEIVAAGSQPVATLLKTGDGWAIEQMDGYRADWPKLQRLLAGLAQARVVERKTDKPAYYARLGVDDVVAEDAGSVLVRIAAPGRSAAILVGYEASGRQGRYVRLHDEAAAVLVDRELEVANTALEWADSEIIDVSASEVAEVEVIHPQGERLLVTRVSAEQTDFELADVPPGREIRSSWTVNSMGSVLSALRLESVRRDTGLDWGKAVKMRLMTFSGVEVTADLLAEGEEYLLRLSAARPAAVKAAPVAGDSAPADQQDAAQQAAEDVEKMVEGIDRRVTGWVYGISKYKFDAMVKKPADLLKAAES